MFLHKYIVDGKKVFVISSDTAPSGQMILKQDNWHGRAVSGNYNRLINWIEEIDKELGYSKKPGEKEPGSEEKKTKKKAYTEELDRIASEFEAGGRPDIALAVDRVSDQIEKYEN